MNTINPSNITNIDSTDSEKYYSLYRIEVEIGRNIINGNISGMQVLINSEDFSSALIDKKTYRESVQTTLGLLSIAKFAAIRGGYGIDSSYSIYFSYVSKTESLHSPNELNSLLCSALLEFTDCVSQVHSMIHPDYSPVIARSIRLIFDRIPEKISLGEIASEVRLTPKYFSALFKKETGVSFSEYVQDIRIENAKKLLETTDLSLLEITNMLNFSSQSYFNQIFKMKTGVTPKEFRTNLQIL